MAANVKHPKHTTQWIAPHLSEGEVKAMYELVLRDVIGYDDVSYHNDVPGFTRADNDRNQLRAEQRTALSTLFGRDNK